jgi:predicted RNA binding protein YcfA (HicA-like mRNA interferase family)
MAKRDKRLQKLRQNQKSVSYDDLKQVLLDHGFEIDRVAGSHHIFQVTADGVTYTLNVPVHGDVKPVYIRQALSIIDRLTPVDDTTQTPDDSEKETPDD